MTILYTIARKASASELLSLPFGRLFCHRLRVPLQRRKSEQISSAIVPRMRHDYY